MTEVAGDKKRHHKADKKAKKRRTPKAESSPLPVDAEGEREAKKARVVDRRDSDEDGDGEAVAPPQAAAAAAATSSLERERLARKKLLASQDRMPDWMRESVKIAPGVVPMKSLVLSKRMLGVLQEMHIVDAFPVQAAVIPHVMRDTRYVGGDTLVMSATGTGKTLAFAVPIVELLSESRVKRIACLCVLPTKDLAAQVHEVFMLLCAGTRLRVALLAGDRAFHEELEQVASRPDIIVATPGRLRDHLSSDLTRDELRTLRWLVIDEGDRLLSKQYHQWIADLMPMLRNPAAIVEGPFPDPPLQKLLFSATMTSNPRKLAMLELYRPTFFHAVNDADATLQGLPVLPATLTERLIKLAREDDRPLALVWLLRTLLQPAPGTGGVLVFVSTIERAQRLHTILSALLPEQRLGLYASNMALREREASLAAFRSADAPYSAMVVTDVLARGLDIASIRAVVNYDCPFFEQTYVHRVGRTARANQPGTAYTLGLGTELPRWKKMRATLRGGNVEEQPLKADAVTLNALRPAFEDTLERMLRRARGRAGPEELLDLQETRAALARPLLPESLHEAEQVLAKNLSQ